MSHTSVPACTLQTVDYSCSTAVRPLAIGDMTAYGPLLTGIGMYSELRQKQWSNGVGVGGI